jgi:light-regulated signal transduction histidine kinase (bacteriophytochrome)
VNNLSSFVHHSPLPMLHLTKDGKIDIVNGAFEVLVESAWLGRSLEDVWKEFPLARLDEVTKKGTGMKVGSVVLAGRSEQLNIDVSIWPVDSPEGAAGYMLACTPIADSQLAVARRDLTDALEEGKELKRVHDLLLATSDELKRSNRDLQQFAYAAAHDLQEPLRSVVSFMDLLAKHMDGQLDEKGQKYMGIATGAAKRMQVLINDLLTFSRVASKPRPSEPVDCAEVVAFIKSDLSTLIEGANATITVGELPEVLGDQSEIAQLFQNLLSNAIKFRSPDRPLHIDISAQRQPFGQWLFAIKDNGIGLEMEYADRIFVIFQRLHTRTKYEGTGIGLALCRKIVERHGGKIWVKSEPDVGTTFNFTLPEARTNSELNG